MSIENISRTSFDFTVEKIDQSGIYVFGPLLAAYQAAANIRWSAGLITIDGQFNYGDSLLN